MGQTTTFKKAGILLFVAMAVALLLGSGTALAALVEGRLNLPGFTPGTK